MMTALFVALGGAIGAVLRYLTGVLTLRLLGPGFPWATLCVNVLGSFIMGCVVIWMAERDALRFAPFVMTGVLGGFTTFSAFSLDAVALAQRGQIALAAIYVSASVGAGLLALIAGMGLAKGVLT